MPWAQMRMYAQKIGMKPKPLVTPTVGLLASWVRSGPLWTDGIPVDWAGNVAGTGHVVVLAGCELYRTAVNTRFMYMTLSR